MGMEGQEEWRAFFLRGGWGVSWEARRQIGRREQTDLVPLVQACCGRAFGPAFMGVGRPGTEPSLYGQSL